MTEIPKLIFITGPTATGKSSLTVDLAEEFEGEIVNIDSMQVYRGMDIGTAKPTAEEQGGIPHHMFDVVDPDDEFNASMYREMAEPVIREIVRRKKACLIVGGTGLYIKTLLGGLLQCPPADMELRERLRRECDEKGPETLHERLKGLDPESAANIHPNDRVRVIRALEIISLTGEPLSSIQQKHDFRDNRFLSLKICLDLDREHLYSRINQRSISMINAGLLEETRSLLNRGYSDDLKPMKSLGYRHAVSYLKKEYNFEEMTRLLQRDTRRYAKRQLTWFRGDPDMIWVEPYDRDMILNKIKEFIHD